MEKKLHFALIFIGIHCIFTPLFGTSEMQKAFQFDKTQNFCTAPAPDSIRLISRTNNTASIAWSLVPNYTLYNITILTRPDSLTPWNTNQMFSNISGGAFTFNGINEGYDYKFMLSTNCALDEPSIYHAEILMPKIIVEIIVAGRLPDKIKEIPCHNINLSAYNWIGFKVNRIGGADGESNFFEVDYIGGLADGAFRVKRVYDNKNIYAVNESDNYPLPAYLVPFKFRIAKIEGLNSLIDIGRVKIEFNFETEKIIDLCNEPISPTWNNSYGFSVYVEDDEDIPDGKLDERYKQKYINNNQKIEFQNPISESLSIYFPESKNPNKASVRMFALDGTTVLEQTYYLPGNQLTIITDTVLPGIYAIQIQTDTDAFVFKVIKQN